MNIEGKVPMFKQIIREFGTRLPFTQLLMEIHGIIKDDNKSFGVLYRFFEKLENTGLTMRAFRSELNISPMVVCSREFRLL